MPCACGLTACTSASVESLLHCAKNNASPLCTRRAIVLAIVCIMFVSWPLLVYAEAQAGFDTFLVEYHHERAEEVLHSKNLLTDNVQKRTAGDLPKLCNRKFLRQDTDSSNNFGKESNLELVDLLPKGALLGSEGGKFVERHSNFPYRRILIPATNVCTNKDISISQGPDGSSGIPRYFVQIVNTCMSDCAPSQVRVYCDECTNKDISITQRRDGSPGIPRFSVQIVNTCVSDCAPADIHVYCGWFASSPPPNPNTFQRVSYNDCLVNGGRPLGHGAIIQFQLSMQSGISTRLHTPCTRFLEHWNWDTVDCGVGWDAGLFLQ